MKKEISLTSAMFCVLIGIVIGYMLNRSNKNKECGFDSCPRSCGNCPYCKKQTSSPTGSLEIPKPQQTAVVKQQTPINEIKGSKEGIGNIFSDIYKKGMQKMRK